MDNSERNLKLNLILFLGLVFNGISYANDINSSDINYKLRLNDSL